ncbi:MAG: hypothetical protein ACOX77_00620 [Caldicoprobacterales bacterium]|jgi:hypothetical protein
MEWRKAAALGRTLKAASFRQDAGLEAAGFSNGISLSFVFSKSMLGEGSLKKYIIVNICC